MLGALNAVVLSLAAGLILLDVVVMGIILSTCAISLLLLSIMVARG